MNARNFVVTGLVAVGLVVSGCASTDELDGIRLQLSDVQQQVLQIQKQTSSKQEVAELGESISADLQTLVKSDADLRLALEELVTHVDQLQAKLEDTNYRLAQLSQQIAATNQELKSLRSSPGFAIGNQEGESSAAAPANPDALYQTAYNDYLRGNYDLAILGFRQYLESFPDTDLADNASYWIGECYFSQGKFREAIREFNHVLSRYPRSDKTASVLLKKGYAYLELGERAQGVVQLQNVIREFPGSDEANLARQRLQSLNLDAG